MMLLIRNGAKFVISSISRRAATDGTNRNEGSRFGGIVGVLGLKANSCYLANSGRTMGYLSLVLCYLRDG